MGELRERMEADLRLRRMSENTRLAYLRCVRDFAAYHRRSPAEMGEPEVRAFLTHLVDERHVRTSTQGVYAAALRFLFTVTLRRPEVSGLIPRPPHRAGAPRDPVIVHNGYAPWTGRKPDDPGATDPICRGRPYRGLLRPDEVPDSREVSRRGAVHRTCSESYALRDNRP